MDAGGDSVRSTLSTGPYVGSCVDVPLRDICIYFGRLLLDIYRGNYQTYVFFELCLHKKFESYCSNNSCVSTAMGSVLSVPACVFGKIKRALAVDRGKCQAFL